MKSNRQWLAAILVGSMLSACATQGDRVKIPVTMPGGEKATIIAHNQSVPDWMLDQKKLKLNVIVKGDIAPKQLAAIAEAERACRIYTNTVRPSNLVAVLSSGVLYFAFGYFGIGYGSQAFSGAKFSEYAYYGGVATGAAGLANGIITLGGQTYTFENCGREVLGLFPGYEVRVIMKSPY